MYINKHAHWRDNHTPMRRWQPRRERRHLENKTRVFGSAFSLLSRLWYCISCYVRPHLYSGAVLAADGQLPPPMSRLQLLF